jgi:hypothetical protein
MPGDGFMALSHSGSAAASSRAGRVGVYLVPEGHYCARVNTVQSYGDVNREVSKAPQKHDSVRCCCCGGVVVVHS